MRGIYNQPEEEQKKAIEAAGSRTESCRTTRRIIVKDRIAVEVQFGKYAFVAHDLFVKHLSFLRGG